MENTNTAYYNMQLGIFGDVKIICIVLLLNYSLIHFTCLMAKALQHNRYKPSTNIVIRCNALTVFSFVILLLFMI